MSKFIKMKYHNAYLLYYSVLFVVVVIFTLIENSSANWSLRWKNVIGFALFYVWNVLSAPVETKTRKSCSRYKIKWQ